MEAKTEEIIMAGFGGQGILFLGKILAELGMEAGNNVSWIPSYGPEMRGGTANCAVVLSNDPIASPVVTEPDVVLAMNRPSVARFNAKVKKGGTIICNSTLIENEAIRDDLKVLKIPATEVADKLSNPRVANLVMAGAYCFLSKLIKYQDAVKVLPSLIPAKRQDLAQINLAAFTRGFELAKAGGAVAAGVSA